MIFKWRVQFVKGAPSREKGTRDEVEMVVHANDVIEAIRSTLRVVATDVEVDDEGNMNVVHVREIESVDDISGVWLDE